MRAMWAAVLAPVLAGCNLLPGGAIDVDYSSVIVPVVKECASGEAATDVMEVGFAKVRAACETFFVDATRAQQNALAARNTLDAGLIGAAAIIPVTSSAAAAVKALAVTTAGITFGKALISEYNTTYAFGTHLHKLRQLVTADMDNFAATARTNPPQNACRAYSLVQEFAIKCTLASLKDIENQQMNIPSGPVVTADVVVSTDPTTKAVTRTLTRRTTPSVGVTIAPY